MTTPRFRSLRSRLTQQPTIPLPSNAELLAAARAIAEISFVLHAIRQQKIIAIERLKDATAIALRKGDNSFILDLKKGLDIAKQAM